MDNWTKTNSAKITYYFVGSENVQVNSMIAVKQLDRSEAFQLSPCVMNKISFITTVSSYFSRCNIFSKVDMAKRYNETLANFKRLANDPRCPPPLIKDGPIWASHTNSLDTWFLGADTLRKVGIQKRIRNLPALRTDTSSGGAK